MFPVADVYVGGSLIGLLIVLVIILVILRVFGIIGLVATTAALWPAIALAQDVPGDQPTPAIDELFRMPPATLWALFTGMVIPLAVAAINRYRWPSDIKLAVYFVVCLASTAGIVWIRGDFRAGNYFQVLLVVLVASTATYLATKSAIKTLEARTG